MDTKHRAASLQEQSHLSNNNAVNARVKYILVNTAHTVMQTRFHLLIMRNN